MADSIGKSDVDFNTSQELISTTAITNAKVWKLDDTWLTYTFTPAKTQWATTWQAYQNPTARNTNITFAKNEARKNYEPLLRNLVTMLVGNPVVTDGDLHAMGIVGRNTKGGPIPAPTTIVESEIKLPAPATVEIHFRDNGETGHAKPHGVRGAEIRWVIAEVPPTDWDELSHSEFDTRSPFTLSFRGDQRGKTIYFALRWENTTGEKGPWSEIESAIIP